MHLPIHKWVNTVDLRQSYQNRDFHFEESAESRAAAKQKVCLVGSCRILNFLNFFRVYNHFSGHPFELICLNPVECWNPGSPVADGVNAAMNGIQIGEVDWVICEHVEHCGVMNTVEDAGQNIFKNLGCVTKNPVIRMPNWIYMFMYDSELAHIEKDYAELTGDARVVALRKRTDECRERFLRYCRESSILGLEAWTLDVWLSTRLGWTSSHSSIHLSRRIFNGIAAIMQLTLTPAILGHEHFTHDRFASTGTVLAPVDYEANHWKF